jgi:hypothetical protein
MGSNDAFFAVKRGLSFGGGSTERTSIPAPAIISLLRASARSSSHYNRSPGSI